MGHFLPFYLPNSPKNQNEKKEKRKKHLEISFYISVPKIMIICYTAPEIWHVTDVIVIFHFGLFVALFTLLTAQKIKFFKKWKKKTWRYLHFTYVYQKLWSDDVWYLRYGAKWMDRRTDGWTDGWKKWLLEVGAPPKNIGKCK